MEHHWNNGGSSGIRPAFLATRVDENYPLNFMYCYNFDHNEQRQGSLEQVEAHQGMMLDASRHSMENNNNLLHHEAAALIDRKSSSYGNVHQHDMKKKRLNDEQLDALERSFREEIKLDPERKMRLARELGMQPRQIAVWFQNRRARWKNKQLERMYDALKLDFDVVSREKLRLQEEVVKLRGILRDRLHVASPEEQAENLLGLNQKQQQHGIGSIAVQLHQQIAGETTSHFTSPNLGQEYANSQQLLSPNYWATHPQLPHYP